VLNDTLFSSPAQHNRLLQAIVPDVIAYQEINTHTATQTRDAVAAALGGTWYAASNTDCKVVSRWPITSTRNINGNLGALIDLPDATYQTDLYVFSAHTPCCTDDTGRQAEIDNIMSWVRDLITAGGVQTLSPGTPIVITGDMNLVGLAQQRRTLLTGDIGDNGTYGADFSPDWDATALLEVYPRHTAGREAHTWHSDGSSFGPGWLDFIGYTDSVATVHNHFALWTPSMAPGDLSAANLLVNDTPQASDHIPFVADFAVALQPGVPAGLVLFGASD
jgi:endonuclease/exonuclease/phosphatase family metal-dependent hydrolase